MIEIKKAEHLIKEIAPEFEFLKWNTYSLFFDEDMTRITIARRPNKWYKVRATFIIPFTFIPYCFWWGFVNVRRAIRDSYTGCWTIGQTCDQETYDKIKQYLIETQNYEPKEPKNDFEVVENDCVEGN